MVLTAGALLRAARARVGSVCAAPARARVRAKEVHGARAAVNQRYPRGARVCMVPVWENALTPRRAKARRSSSMRVQPSTRR